MFLVSSHLSSGIHKTVTTASDTSHIIGAAVVTFLCIPDDGCDDTRNV